MYLRYAHALTYGEKHITYAWINAIISGHIIMKLRPGEQLLSQKQLLTAKYNRPRSSYKDIIDGRK